MLLLFEQDNSPFAVKPISECSKPNLKLHRPFFSGENADCTLDAELPESCESI